MKPVVDDRDEEMQRARRAERIAQMRREKQLQEQRRQMIRRYLPLGAGALGAIILLSVVIAFVVKTQEDKAQQAQIEASEEGTALTDSMGLLGTTQRQGQSNVTGADNAEENNTTGVPNAGENNADREESTATVSDTVKLPTPVYTFELTSDTKNIYSEEVISTNAILINESTDTIIASKGARERICPASMTKVLTVLVAAEHMTEADLENTFTMTREITDYAYVNDCSSVGFLDGEKVTVKDLFYGTTLHSGGDAAVGLATYVAGSHEAFVDMMNEKLADMGLAESAHFTNCVGLYDDNHYCTVYDMAVIMKAAMQNELCREFLSKHTYTTTPTAEHPEGIEISNWFLRRIEDKDTGGEVLCAKTGYVVQSKNCAVSYGTFTGGTPYICVTAGSTSNWRCIYDHVEIYNRYVQADK